MTKAQENLKADIEKINDEVVIEKVRIFISGILAQKGIDERQKESFQDANAFKKRKEEVGT